MPGFEFSAADLLDLGLLGLHYLRLDNGYELRHRLSTVYLAWQEAGLYDRAVRKAATVHPELIPLLLTQADIAPIVQRRRRDHLAKLAENGEHWLTLLLPSGETEPDKARLLGRKGYSFVLNHHGEARVEQVFEGLHGRFGVAVEPETFGFAWRTMCKGLVAAARGGRLAYLNEE